jgi:hypothetical protein
MARIVTIRVAGQPRRIAVTAQLAMLAQGLAEKGDLPPSPDGDAEYWLPWLVLWLGDRSRDGQPFEEWLLDMDLEPEDTDVTDVVSAVRDVSQSMGDMLGSGAAPDPTPAAPSSG